MFAVLPVGNAARAEGMTIAPVDGQSMEIASNRHVQPYGEIKTVTSTLDTDGFQLVARTDVAELWLSEAYHTIRIVDLRTGYVWGAIPLEGARNLNASWRSYAGSIVSIEVYDSRNVERRYGLLGNAKVEYSLLEDGFAFSADFEQLGISLAGSVRLVGNSITFELEEGSLVERGSHRLKSLAFVPFLGSVFGDEIEGWFLLPDGPGTLMRFRPPGSYVAGYDNRVYGTDLAVDELSEPQSLGTSRPNDYVISPNQVLVPVYGIVHGIRQNGLLCVIEEGAHYASIVATPAGLNNMRYNSIMTRFEYRQSYSRTATRSGAGALVPQEHMNIFTPKQSLYLLSGAQADYDQMAVFYRDLLIADGTLGSSLDHIHLQICILGADVRPVALWKQWRTFTTISEAKSIVESLRAGGVDDLLVVLRNYTEGNVAGRSLNSRLGSLEELEDMRQEVEGLSERIRGLQEGIQGPPGGTDGLPGGTDGLTGGTGGLPGGIDGLPGGIDGLPGGIDGLPGGIDGLQWDLSAGGRLLLYLDPVRANEDQINLRLQAAHAMNKSPIRIQRDNRTALYQDTYFFRPDVVDRATLQHVLIFSGHGTAVDQLGSRLFGDCSTGKESTRADNMQRFLSLLHELSVRQGRCDAQQGEADEQVVLREQPGGHGEQRGGRESGKHPGYGLALYTPNQIAWPYADTFLDFPLVGGQYLFETDTVPFLPIVLKGSMALFSPFLNTGYFGRDRLLRMVEYGVCPSFVVTWAPSSALARTASEDFYSTCFSDWRDYILEAYRYVKAALETVAGLRIVAHTAEDFGRVRVTYEDGTNILVNYTDGVWETENGTVLPHDYLVAKRGMIR
jgi:hypothetical protein